MIKVGELLISDTFDIMYNTDDNKYYTVLQNNQKEIKGFTWKERTHYLYNPWDHVRYYEDELGFHYLSIVYDWISIDIYAKTIEELFNLICRMLKLSDETIDISKAK